MSTRVGTPLLMRKELESLLVDDDGDDDDDAVRDHGQH